MPDPCDCGILHDPHCPDCNCSPCWAERPDEEWFDYIHHMNGGCFSGCPCNQGD